MNAVRITIAAAVAIVLCLAGAGTSLAMNTGDPISAHSTLTAGNANTGGVYVITAQDGPRAGDAVETGGDGYLAEFHAAGLSGGASASAGDASESELLP